MERSHRPDAFNAVPLSPVGGYAFHARNLLQWYVAEQEHSFWLSDLYLTPKPVGDANFG